MDPQSQDGAGAPPADDNQAPDNTGAAPVTPPAPAGGDQGGAPAGDGSAPVGGDSGDAGASGAPSEPTPPASV